jgi:phosphate transport system substrate-binding protein
MKTIRLHWLAVMMVVLFLCLGNDQAEVIMTGDRTGSWNQINQNIRRPENWVQISTTDAFKLGEERLAGTWLTTEGKQDYYERDFGTYPSLDGSTVSVPMAMEFARQLLGLSDENAAGFVKFSTTHKAYLHLIHSEPNPGSLIRSDLSFLNENQPVDLVIATEPSAEELALAESEGVALIKKPVCFDAFVFITGDENPVNSLTADQIRGIYSGEIVNWKQVGGDDLAIKAFQREANSGSQTAMENLVMKGIPMLPAQQIKMVGSMGELIEVVQEFQNNSASIGYTYKYYLDMLYAHDRIKVLKVDGISPEPENLRNQSYPFTVNYFGVIRAVDSEKTGGKFLDWMLSDEGQRSIEQAGYIPMRDD